MRELFKQYTTDIQIIWIQNLRDLGNFKLRNCKKKRGGTGITLYWSYNYQQNSVFLLFIWCQNSKSKKAAFRSYLYDQYILRCTVPWTWNNILETWRQKINQQNAQINSGLIYYWSITPKCFCPSVEAIIREFEILESYKAIVLIC